MANLLNKEYSSEVFQTLLAVAHLKNVSGKSRSSRPEVFCKKGVFRNFAKSTGKQLCQSLLFTALGLQLYLNRVSETGVFM